MSTKINHLSVLNRGTIEYPRYLIGDDHGQFWTGEEWTDKESEGRIYNDWNEVGNKFQKLLENQRTPTTETRTFVAPLTLRVMGDEEFSLEELKDWAFKASRLLMDHPTFGVGPKSSLAVTSINWDQTREVENG